MRYDPTRPAVKHPGRGATARADLARAFGASSLYLVLKVGGVLGGLLGILMMIPKGGLSGIGKGSNENPALRTDDPMAFKWVVIGCLAIVASITLATPLQMNVLGALLILVFGFLFSIVSS